MWDYGYIANPIDGPGGLWTLRQQKTVQPIQKTPPVIAKSSTFTTDTNADATLTPAKIQLISDPL